MKGKKLEIDISNYVPVGHKNAISRRQLAKRAGLSDRELRYAIKASKKLICNLSDGKGYFIPDKNESALVKHFMLQERKRQLAVEHVVSQCCRWLQRTDDDVYQLSLWDEYLE